MVKFKLFLEHLSEFLSRSSVVDKKLKKFRNVLHKLVIRLLLIKSSQMLPFCTVGQGSRPLSGHTKDFRNGTCYLSIWHFASLENV